VANSKLKKSFIKGEYIWVVALISVRGLHNISHEADTLQKNEVHASLQQFCQTTTAHGMKTEWAALESALSILIGK